MSSRVLSSALLALLVGLPAVAAPPKPAPAPAPIAVKTAADVVARYDQIMSPTAFVAVMEMVATREDGSTRSYVLRTQKVGADKFRATFEEPASARGQEMLRVGDNMWSYVPNLKRAVRVASRDSFMGGDFNNGDVLRVNYTADYDATFLEGGDPTLVCAKLTAKAPSVAYDVIHLCLTKDAVAMPVSASYFAQSGKLLRSAVFSDVKDFGGGNVRPAKIVMKNEIQTARQSAMTWSAFDVKESIPNSRFVVEDLGR
jgi:hypothetical protein